MTVGAVILVNSHDACELEILIVSVLQMQGQSPRSSNIGRVSEPLPSWVKWGLWNTSPWKKEHSPKYPEVLAVANITST